MDASISFDVKWLKAAAIIAPRNDIRYYLNGVLVDVFEQEARLVVTDGHRLAIFRKTIADGVPHKLIVPIDVIGLLKPRAVNGKTGVATFSYDPEKPTAKAMLEYRDIGFRFTPIDGKYPDYSQTMNKATTPSGVVSQFQLPYLYDFGRMVDAAFGSGRLYPPSIWHNGDGPAAVTYKDHDDFFGIVMPLRADSEFIPPAWTLPKPEPEVALAA